jgi:uncharacterized protein YndB with AHSA1/START domain
MFRPRRARADSGIPMKKSFLCFAAGLLLLVCSLQVAGQEADAADPAVKVRKSGELVVIDVSMTVPASPQETWNVLTDYDHMAQFVPNLQASSIVARTDRALQVEQKGSISFGPFSIPFESVREIELKPFAEIRSHAISGSLGYSTAVTRLAPEDDGVRVSYHSESVPNVWVPPGVGPRAVAKQTRIQFEMLRNEILKRKGVEKQ